MGRAFIFGDGIDTDALAPGNRMKLPASKLAQHCLEAIRPGFANEVKPGDFIVAGSNFGQGSSREQAASSLKILGVSAVIASSFARIFYRNAMNLGLPPVTFDPAGKISDGDEIEVELKTGKLHNLTTGQSFTTQPFPEHLLIILNADGLIPYLEAKLADGTG